MKTNFGVIGLGTMGANLARNIASRGFKVSVFNRTFEKTEKFISEFKNLNFTPAKTLKEFVNRLDTPRKMIIMVKAGEAVDQVLKELTPHLSKGDIIIDGGNSHYKDTENRQAQLAKKNLNLIGMGISGGEEGALHGPSMMPSGSKAAYQKIAKILHSAAASDNQGGKCLTYIGPSGSGHFVKMVHNGIEYALMQLIAESYDLLKRLGNFSNRELAKTFNQWNKSKYLKSFLIEISGKIFSKKDPKTGKDLIDLIKDQAEQKGTGKLTSIAAFDYGSAAPTIHAAVDARIMSGNYQMRQKSGFPVALLKTTKLSKTALAKLVQNALTLSTIYAYIQGLEIIYKAGLEENWQLNLSEIARIWRGGCIIRNETLLKIFQDVYSEDNAVAKTAKIATLKLYKGQNQKDWRRLLQLAIAAGIPFPAHTSALFYYDSLRTPRLPQNLIQAQRDFFGAHGFERLDTPGSFHENWT